MVRPTSSYMISAGNDHTLGLFMRQESELDPGISTRTATLTTSGLLAVYVQRAALIGQLTPKQLYL